MWRFEALNNRAGRCEGMAKKRSTPNPVVLWLLGLVVPAYIRLVYFTTKWDIVGEEYYDQARNAQNGMIVAFWHSRIMMMIALRKNYPRKFHFMISGHRDGEMIARAIKAFDIEVARGSAANPRKQEKNKSGSNALRHLVRALGRGEGVGLTPDGPRGPRQRCHAGVVQLARLSGLPVIPVAYAVRRVKIFDSWDRFHLPLPFSRGVYVFGKPVDVLSNESELKAARQKVENALNDVTEAADAYVGISQATELKASQG
jgi:hypothetical protein